MSMRIPSTQIERGPHGKSTCEDVLDIVLHSTPGVIDAADVRRVADGQPALERYVRDTLNLFVELGQIERVRRSLWIAEPPPSWTSDPVEDRRIRFREELLRAHVATRASGSWCVIAGPWALGLHGVVRDVDELVVEGIRYCVSPRPSRPATYAKHGRASLLAGGSFAPHAALERRFEHRHVMQVRGAPVATIARRMERLGAVEWIHDEVRGVHVQSVESALLCTLEHPRLSGGHETARALVIPVLLRVGLERVLRAGREHPVLAVRRRLAFLLLDATWRLEETTTAYPHSVHGYGRPEEGRWRMQRALGVTRRSGVPTPLEPHLIARGPLDRSLGLIDNRGAPRLPRRHLHPEARAIAGKL